MVKPSKGFNSPVLPIAVSLCLIVKNEAARISNCLKSAASFVDEMIVVDTGSTDQTTQIAKKLGAQVYKFEWCDDFAAARNYALQQVKGQWVLVLDGDEELELSMISVLKDAIAQPNHLVVNLTRAEIGTRRSPYSLVSRLFRRHPDIHFTGFYHELIDHSVQKILEREPDWQVVTVMQVAIHHYGYQLAEIAKKQKFDFARNLMTKHLQHYPDDVYMYSKLGALQIESGEVESGLELLQTGLLTLVDRHDHQIQCRVDQPDQQCQTLFELNYHLGIAYSQINDLNQQPANLETAKSYYQIAIELDVPNLVKLPALNNLGNLLQTQADYTGAIAVYQKVVEIAPDFAIGYYNLGIVHRHANNYLESIAAYERAIQINPEFAQAYQNLGLVLIQTAQTPRAIAAFNQAIKYHLFEGNKAIADQIRQLMDELGCES
jgi:tetratricopeptide (TPR) repeat protein